jgi:hypothetical protein
LGGHSRVLRGPHQGESKSIVKSPENSIFQALAIGFHWFFKLFFYNGFLWEIFFSESDISRTKNLRHMKFGMMKYHIMTFKNKVVAPSSGTGAILKKPQNLFVKYLKKDNMLTVAN